MNNTTDTNPLLALAERPDLVGRTIYSYEGRNILASVIESITIEDDTLLVITLQLPVFVSNDHEMTWSCYDSWHTSRISVRADWGTAYISGEDEITISMPLIGNAVIAPSNTPLPMMETPTH